MRSQPTRTALTFTVTMAALLLGGGDHRAVAQDGIAPPPPDAAVRPEVLLRGPLHEAFAEVVNFNPQPGIVVAKTPPNPIAEMPPEVKPDDNSIWIPGYWAWDDDRNDFIWISGVWRVAPPDRRWVPGYWTRVDAGYQWIPGFWAQAEADVVEFQPNPPQTLELGPNGPAPADDYFWVSGCWVLRGAGYVWRPGLWTRGYADWIWVPSYYVWTPRGCIYVRGYWDYPVVDRGMCFAPVYFPQPIVWQVGRTYWPQVAIDLPWLHLHLFVRPQYSHYYFGDWYAGYDRLGIYTTYAFHDRWGYDPVWTYFQCVGRGQGIDYAARVRGWSLYYQQHADMRPPHTWADQQRFVARNTGSPYLKQTVLAVRVEDMPSRRGGHVERLSETQRRDVERRSAATLELVEARRQAETGPGRDVRGPSATPGQVSRESLRLPLTPDAQQARARAANRAAGPRETASQAADRPRGTDRSGEIAPTRTSPDRGAAAAAIPEARGRAGAESPAVSARNEDRATDLGPWRALERVVSEGQSLVDPRAETSRSQTRREDAEDAGAARSSVAREPLAQPITRPENVRPPASERAGSAWTTTRVERSPAPEIRAEALPSPVRSGPRPDPVASTPRTTSATPRTSAAAAESRAFRTSPQAAEVQRPAESVTRPAAGQTSAISRIAASASGSAASVDPKPSRPDPVASPTRTLQPVRVSAQPAAGDLSPTRSSTAPTRAASATPRATVSRPESRPAAAAVQPSRSPWTTTSRAGGSANGSSAVRSFGPAPQQKDQQNDEAGRQSGRNRR